VAVKSCPHCGGKISIETSLHRHDTSRNGRHLPGFEEPDGFEEFWALVPSHRRKEKPLVHARWKVAIKKEIPSRIHAAYRRHLDSEDWTRDGGKYIPHPKNWLAHECWADAVTPRARDPREDDRDHARDLFRSLKEGR